MSRLKEFPIYPNYIQQYPFQDWRAHLEQMQTYHTSITDTLAIARTQLSRLSEEVKRSLEKIGSREKYLNSQLDGFINYNNNWYNKICSGLLNTFRQAQDRLAETREKYRDASGGVTTRSRRLAELSDELDHIKQQMEERGVSLTDGGTFVCVCVWVFERNKLNVYAVLLILMSYDSNKQAHT
jgi:estrogen-related receptor beta like 1